MHSATATPDEDRTSRARIRDAAIARFADQGVAATSLKVIAEDAGVSAPLVVHHFGSKEGLRAACDAYVAAVIREGKQQVMAQGPQLDPLGALRRSAQGPPVLAYLARTLGDGSPQVAAVLDELVEDAVAYMEEGVRTGLLKASDHPRGRAVVLTLWSLGAVMLHEHAERWLGVDLTADPEHATAYLLPAVEILSRGVFADEVYEHVRGAVTDPEEAGS